MTSDILTNRQLVEHLKRGGALKTPQLLDAFNVIDRADFVDQSSPGHIYADHPLPIGEEQTISQPTTVAFMMELLQPLPGDKILDVGAGSGWTTALLGQIVGNKGKVLGLEIIPELARKAQANLTKYQLPQAQVQLGSGAHGNRLSSPFDKILVSAAADKIPEELKSQLVTGGTMVIPVANSIWCIKRKSKTKYHARAYPGFIFVPLKTWGGYGSGSY